MITFRTHTCGELNKTHKGQNVSLSGWVHKKRDHGNLLFLDLRDNYGISQCVIEKGHKNFDKSHQNTNWLKRPITKSQINYLKKDVLYLKKIHDLQVRNLKKFKKLGFAKEEFKAIAKNISESKGINSKFKKKIGIQIYKSKEFHKILQIRDKKSKQSSIKAFNTFCYELNE